MRGVKNIREFIVQWNRDGLDLFEYTKEHEIKPIIIKTYAVDIVYFIMELKDKCIIHIENCPVYHLLHRDLEELNFDNGICYEAERWHKHRWLERLQPMKYIAYWELLRPARVDELERLEFDFDKWNGL
jgi:hypothetical protein